MSGKTGNRNDADKVFDDMMTRILWSLDQCGMPTAIVVASVKADGSITVCPGCNHHPSEVPEGTSLQLTIALIRMLKTMADSVEEMVADLGVNLDGTDLWSWMLARAMALEDKTGRYD